MEGSRPTKHWHSLWRYLNGNITNQDCCNRLPEWCWCLKHVGKNKWPPIVSTKKFVISQWIWLGFGPPHVRRSPKRLSHLGNDFPPSTRSRCTVIIKPIFLERKHTLQRGIRSGVRLDIDFKFQHLNLVQVEKYKLWYVRWMNVQLPPFGKSSCSSHLKPFTRTPLGIYEDLLTYMYRTTKFGITSLERLHSLVCCFQNKDPIFPRIVIR